MTRIKKRNKVLTLLLDIDIMQTLQSEKYCRLPTYEVVTNPTYCSREAGLSSSDVTV